MGPIPDHPGYVGDHGAKDHADYSCADNSLLQYKTKLIEMKLLNKKKIMRKLAQKGGFIWVVLAIIPIATIVWLIGKACHLDDNLILLIELPSCALQLLSLFMIIRYNREIF